MSLPMVIVDFIPVILFLMAAMTLIHDLSSKDFSSPAMNWIGEGVNVTGMSLFLLGVKSLHIEGLESFEL